jgi:hypothetical protein
MWKLVAEYSKNEPNLIGYEYINDFFTGKVFSQWSEHISELPLDNHANHVNETGL